MAINKDQTVTSLTEMMFMGRMFDSKQSFGNIILLLGMDSFKNVVNKIIDKMNIYLSDWNNYTSTYDIIRSALKSILVGILNVLCLRKIMRLFRKKQVKKEVIIEKENKDEVIIHFTPFNEFWKLLKIKDLYIHKHFTVQFGENVLDIKIRCGDTYDYNNVNTKETNVVFKIQDMVFDYKDCSFSIKDTLTLHSTNGEVNINEVGDGKSSGFHWDWTLDSLFDNIKDEQIQKDIKEAFSKYWDNCVTRLPNMVKERRFVYSGTSDQYTSLCITANGGIYRNVQDKLKDHTGERECRFLHELTWVFQFLLMRSSFGKIVMEYTSKYIHFIGTRWNTDSKCYRSHSNIQETISKVPNITKFLDTFNSDLIARVRSDNKGSDGEEQKDISMMVVGSSKFDNDKSEILSAWYNLNENIIGQFNTKSDNDKVNVFELNVLTKYKINTLPNPKYTTWKNKYSKIINQDPTKESLQSHLDIPDAPAETIEISEEMHPEVEVRKINSLYKDPKTLYLKERDEETMFGFMNNFKHNKHVIEQLGLPYKLSMLLHGSPGTGKTSSVQILASYLQKDIYYINLNNVKTNKALLMVFEYVNKKCVNGGIIVMEDIDVMCKVVLKRGERGERGTEEGKEGKESLHPLTPPGDELTLSYFLNILQGGLTIEGTIFVATTNDIDVLDPAFIRPGRFDLRMKLDMCDHYQFQMIYLKFFGRKIPDILLCRIKEMKYTPAAVISELQKYIIFPQPDEKILEIFVEPFESLS